MKSQFLIVTWTILLCLGLVSGHRHNPLSTFKSKMDMFAFGGISVAESQTATLSVEPTLLNQTGDWVTVSFMNIEKPTSSDFIAAYTPSTVNITATSPVKYQYANISSDYMSTGNGSMRFRLVNMFSDYVFVFYRNGTAFPIYSLRSNVVEFTNYRQALQPHIALTGIPNQMRVSWASGASMKQYTKWGYVSGQYSNVNTAITSTYSSDMLCGPPANKFGWREPGNLQTVVIEFDNTQERVFYVIGNDLDGYSSEYSFAVPPPIGRNSNVKLVAYGDMGKGEIDQSLEHWEEIPSVNTTRNVLNKIKNEQFELVIHIGDIAYAVGYSAQWDEFMDQIAPVASGVPYMTLPGNHERDYNNTGGIFNCTDSGGECGIPYEHRFLMPNTNRLVQWYSFDYGNIHFVMFSTEHNFSVGSEQFEFIVNDLQSVDRSITPWIILSGHRPMYIDSTGEEEHTGDQPVAQLLRDNLEFVLLKYQVDLVLWGHHHSYQRSCPVYNGTCSDGRMKLPIHCVIGMAGMGLSVNLESPPPAWIDVVDDQIYGYSTIETTSTQLQMQFYDNQNNLLDTFKIHSGF